MKPYSILIQKTKSGSVLKDTEKDFGVVLLDVDMQETDIKNLPGNDWGDESGEDVFIPDCLLEKAYDFSLKIGYKGNVDIWEEKIDAFMDYLTGYDKSGVEMLVYLPYHKMGRKCRLSKIPRPTPYIQGSDLILEMRLEMRVDKPRIRIELVKGVEGQILSLREKVR